MIDWIGLDWIGLIGWLDWQVLRVFRLARIFKLLRMGSFHSIQLVYHTAGSALQVWARVEIMCVTAVTVTVT